MAEAITLEEKERRFDEALDKLQRSFDAGGGVPDEIFNEFLVAAENYRSDARYKALLGSAGADATAMTSRSPIPSWRCCGLWPRKKIPKSSQFGGSNRDCISAIFHQIIDPINRCRGGPSCDNDLSYE